MSSELRIALVAGTLSFVAAIAGTFVSSVLEERRNSHRYTAELRAKIIETRLELLDKCTTSRSQIGRARTLWGFKTAENKRLLEAQRQGKLESYVPTLFTPDMQKEFSAIQTLHFSCVQLGSVLFGPKTRSAGQEVNKRPTDGLPDENSKELNLFYESQIAELLTFDEPTHKP